jgi:hypothetical protein
VVSPGAARDSGRFWLRPGPRSQLERARGEFPQPQSGSLQRFLCSPCHPTFPPTAPQSHPPGTGRSATISSRPAWEHFGPCPALEIASFWLHLRSSALDPGAVESTLRARTGHTNLLPGHSPEIRHGELVVMHRHRPHRGMRNGHFGKPVWGMKAQWTCGHRHNGVAEPRPSFVTLGSAHRGRRTHVTLHPNRRS